jgi:bifunctional UDP-N-acetylglucosamine pyrophosphorylase/glucosamine-1-phosphate N-acetyltransferase
MNKVQIIILAAGKGKRMNGDLPKVLVPLFGRPMISHLLETIEKIEDKPFGVPYIVVGHGKDNVIKTLGEKYNYVEQKEQLGTGHAVNTAKHSVKEEADSIVVLYGDHPFISSATIQKLITKQSGTNKKIVMATVKLPDFTDWRANFLEFSRVVRDKDGKILKTVENKDATEEEKKITEVNPCYFCFDAKFLWQELDALKNDNAQQEYYLTDVLKSAIEKNIEVESIEINPKEALGANSKQELEILESLAL